MIPWRKQKWRKNYSGWGHTVTAILFILFTVNWNASLTRGTAYIDGPIILVAASVLRLDQYWGMFSPFPLVEDGWYLAILTVPITIH